MFVTNEKLKDPLYITGLILIPVSFLLFMAPVIQDPPRDAAFGGLFLMNFLMAAVFVIMLRISGIFKQGRTGIHHVFLFLILLLISAYSLNREMAVFEESVTWFSTLLVVVCVNYILFIFFEQAPRWLKHFLCFVAGVAMVVFAYLAFYLFPLYVISVFAAIALGISLHTFVPLLFCICTVVLMKKINAGTNKYWIPFCAGILLPVLFSFGYLIAWNRDLATLNENFRYASVTASNQLPSWVRVAQRLSKDGITEKILKSDLVYAVPDLDRSNWLWRTPSLNFDSKKHDPLVMVSALICGPVNVPVDDRVKILEAMYDARHQAQERLWSGRDLITEHVSTKVELWPSLRISYSELNIMISHIPDPSSWTNSQEAIYTFHLPEGGVVTSLSLWIDGKEEKGVLTTKSKADSAYRTIVGVESRDPSVVHWQEGNTVTVRVFPVLKGQSRKFKVGITAPLLFEKGVLRYQNIYFDGPSYASAEEDVEISSQDGLKVMEVADDFVSNKKGLSKRDGTYSPSWSISFEAPPISGNTFSFREKSYTVRPIQVQTEPFYAKSIFLDINASWSLNECEQVYNLVKDRKVYISDGEDGFKEVNAANKDWLFEELRSNNFSLFPFYKINGGAEALVISKSGRLSPTIDDLRKNHFLNELHRYFIGKKRIRFFNLGTELTPYLKSLKEFRMLEYDGGSVQKLESLLSENIFSKTIENDNSLAVYNAGITINRSDDVRPGTAPDHLMRLFAYNHILQRSGSSILADELNEAPLIEEASEAYIVSPFSSLIVLETQKDYDRFDIAASKNSLQNASTKSKGAVPEPHEWMLIILVLLFCAVLKFRLRPALIRKK